MLKTTDEIENFDIADNTHAPTSAARFNRFEVVGATGGKTVSTREELHRLIDDILACTGAASGPCFISIEASVSASAAKAEIGSDEAEDDSAYWRAKHRAGAAAWSKSGA